MAGVITLSIVLIFLIHQVYEYLKKSFSKPLERNIVNETKSHYEQIYNTLATSRQNQIMPPIEQPTTTQPDNMADELMNFMSDLDNAQPDVVIDNTYEQEIAPYVDDGSSMAAF